MALTTDEKYRICEILSQDLVTAGVFSSRESERWLSFVEKGNYVLEWNERGCQTQIYVNFSGDKLEFKITNIGFGSEESRFSSTFISNLQKHIRDKIFLETNMEVVN